MPKHHPLAPDRVHGFCTSIDATIRGIDLSPKEEEPEEPVLKSFHTSPEYLAAVGEIVHGEPPTKGPLIHLPARARKAFHQHGITTIKQLRALIASGKINHSTYRNYGRTTHNAVLKALKIKPTCPHCHQPIKTK